ncbi:hypothetical protein AB0451_38385 [Streptomyces sp. NPDC052000]
MNGTAGDESGLPYGRWTCPGKSMSAVEEGLAIQTTGRRPGADVNWS